LSAVLLLLSSCGDGGSGPLTEPVVGGDLVLVMQPGEGTETNTGRYLVEIFDPDGKYGLREGTANHVGWIESEYGPRHVVTFTAGRDNPRGGEPELCVIVVTVGIQAVRDEAATFNGGGACGLDADEPMILGGNLGSGSRESARIPMISGGSLGSASLEPADVYGGADGAEAVITTESGKTVSVLATNGFALAEWPREWGLLQMVDFYDTSGDPVGTVRLRGYPEG
jgi:hypothetical protein